MISFIPDFDNSEAKRSFGENAVVYFAEENGERSGKCIFSVSGTVLTFHLFEADRLSFAAEGLIRSALNCAAGRGAYTAKAQSELAADDFIRLGFKQSGDALTAVIPDVLTGGCAK